MTFSHGLLKTALSKNLLARAANRAWDRISNLPVSSKRFINNKPFGKLLRQEDKFREAARKKGHKFTFGDREV